MEVPVLYNDTKEKETLNFKNPHINFLPDTHTYYVRENQYEAVSDILNKYTPEFKTDYWAKIKADEEGISTDEIKENWLIKKDYSIVIGKELHYYINLFLKYSKITLPVTDIRYRISQFHKFLDPFKNKVDILETELMVAHKEYNVAGTIDCLCRNKETGIYFIVDWKTNKNIKRDNRFDSMLGVLSGFDNCEFNKYSLQLGFYKNILKSNFNIQLHDGCLIHFPKNSPYIIMPVKNMDKEVELLLKEDIKKREVR